MLLLLGVYSASWRDRLGYKVPEEGWLDLLGKNTVTVTYRETYFI